MTNIPVPKQGDYCLGSHCNKCGELVFTAVLPSKTDSATLPKFAGPGVLQLECSRGHISEFKTEELKWERFTA